MTREELFRAAIVGLEHSSTEARLDATRILEHVLSVRIADLIAHGDTSVGPAEEAKVLAFVARRQLGEPIAYLCGEVWFYGRRFLVDERVLVPRPETEELVEAALAHLRILCQQRPVKFADVGTGSGAIAATLATELPSSRGLAIDISAAALAVASENISMHGVGDRVKCQQRDLFDGIDEADQFDLVAANLPYLPSADIPTRPAPIAFEPRLALDGGDDGIDIYRRLFHGLERRLRPNAAVLLEAAPPTMPGLFALAECSFCRVEIVVKPDYSGADRFLLIRFP